MKLRPRQTRDLLDAAIALYSRNFIAFVAIVAVIRLPLVLVQAAEYGYMEQSGMLQGMKDPFSMRPEDVANFDMGAFFAMELVAFVGALIIWFGDSVSGGALAYCISERYLGNRATIGGAYRFIVSRLWRLLGVSFLVGLVVAMVGMGGAIVLGVGAGLAAAGIGGWGSAPLGMIPGMIAGALPALVPAVWFAFYVPLVVVENLGGIENMRRSYVLVRGMFWRVAAMMLMLVLIAFVAPVTLITVPVASVGERFMSGVTSQAAMLTVTQLAHQIGLVLTLPVWTAGIVLLYYDMRVRREAFDIETLATQLARA